MATSQELSAPIAGEPKGVKILILQSLRKKSIIHMIYYEEKEDKKMETTMLNDAAYAAGAASMTAYWITLLAITVLLIAASWKIFEKAGVPGWTSLIPFYSQYKLAQLVFGNGWIFLLAIIPCVGFIYNIVFCIKLAKAYGKGVGFGIGLILLNPIFMLILGFGSAEYVSLESR